MECFPGFRYAGFWIRLWATILDCILLMIITVPLVLWIYGLEYFNSQSATIKGPADVLISYVMPMVAAIVLWKYKSATPGKMCIGAKIVDARTGGPLSLGQCCGRYFAYFISIVPFGFGFLWIAWDPRKQAWHDKLAGTVVIRPAKNANG
jgi:uncharacterized RDD family membrane protein YckC